MKDKGTEIIKCGRKPIYDPGYHPATSHKLCSLGLIDAELAYMFDISERSINKWKKLYPEFAECIRRGKMIADSKVAESLFKRATGFTLPETLTFEIQKGEFKKEVERIETVKHYPPDVRACELWLRNRSNFFKNDNA